MSEVEKETKIFQENMTKEEMREKIDSYNKKQQEKGVCYLSKIPPYMSVAYLRSLLNPYGIERIFLALEGFLALKEKLNNIYPDESKRKHRIKKGGNRKKCFTEGWVEFSDKRVAKRVALSLNCTKMVQKKKGFYSEDLWAIRYLPKFKWENLTEKLAYDQRVRKEKLQAELVQEKKKQEFYMEKLDLSKKLMKMEERKGKRKAEKALDSADLEEEDEKKKVMRKFKQHKPVEKKV